MKSVHIRSIDRDTTRYPNANDFSISLGETFHNIISMKLGSIEAPLTKMTVEESENAMYMTEGIAIGDAVMASAYNSATVGTDTYVVPATFMPVTIAGTTLTSAQPHGLQEYAAWSSQDPSRPRPVLIGSDDGTVFLDDFTPVYTGATTIDLGANVPAALRTGDKAQGFLHVPPLHLSELLSLLSSMHSTKRSWTLENGRVVTDGTVLSPAQTTQSATYSLSQVLATRYRVEVPAGFYSEMTMGDVVGSTMMARSNFVSNNIVILSSTSTVGAPTFTIPAGRYTPDLLMQCLNGVCASATVSFSFTVSGKGEIQWTVSSASGPFTMDLSSGLSMTLRQALGFDASRFSGRASYSGTPYRVPCNLNIVQSPGASATAVPLVVVIPGAPALATPPMRAYPRAVYTVSSNATLEKKFQFLAESSTPLTLTNPVGTTDVFSSETNEGTVAFRTASPSGLLPGDAVCITGTINGSVAARAGIVTHCSYDTDAFKTVVEYNADNTGTTAFDNASDLAVDVLVPRRVELFGVQESSDMALLDEPRLTEGLVQAVPRRLGLSTTLSGGSVYVAQNQWWMSEDNYRIVEFLAEGGGSIGNTKQTHTVSDGRALPCFAKIVLPASHVKERWQDLDIDFYHMRNLRRIHIRILTEDHRPYPLHGREVTFTVLLQEKH